MPGGALVVKLCPTLATLWTIACQASVQATGFSKQEYWSGFPFPSLVWGDHAYQPVSSQDPLACYPFSKPSLSPGNSVVIPQLWTSHLYRPMWHPVEGTLGLGSSYVPSPRAAALPGAHEDAPRASRPLSSWVDSGKQATSLSLNVLICKWG